MTAKIPRYTQADAERDYAAGNTNALTAGAIRIAFGRANAHRSHPRRKSKFPSVFANTHRPDTGNISNRVRREGFASAQHRQDFESLVNVAAATAVESFRPPMIFTKCVYAAVDDNGSGIATFLRSGEASGHSVVAGIDATTRKRRRVEENYLIGPKTTTDKYGSETPDESGPSGATVDNYEQGSPEAEAWVHFEKKFPDEYNRVKRSLPGTDAAIARYAQLARPKKTYLEEARQAFIATVRGDFEILKSLIMDYRETHKQYPDGVLYPDGSGDRYLVATDDWLMEQARAGAADIREFVAAERARAEIQRREHERRVQGAHDRIEENRAKGPPVALPTARPPSEGEGKGKNCRKKTRINVKRKI